MDSTASLLGVNIKSFKDIITVAAKKYPDKPP